jgi:hypothetical protein
MTAQHLAAVTLPRRLALFVVVVLQLETTLTDAAPAMFDKLLGSLSRRAERRSEERAHSTGDLRARLASTYRLFQTICSKLHAKAKLADRSMSH